MSDRKAEAIENHRRNMQKAAAFGMIGLWVGEVGSEGRRRQVNPPTTPRARQRPKKKGYGGKQRKLKKGRR